MTTTTQDKEIANLILMDFDPDEIAGEVSDLISKKITKMIEQDYDWFVEWVGKNTDPEDVFDEKNLSGLGCPKRLRERLMDEAPIKMVRSLILDGKQVVIESQDGDIPVDSPYIKYYEDKNDVRVSNDRMREDV